MWVLIKNISSLLTVIIIIIKLNNRNYFLKGNIMKIIGFEIKHCNAGWRDFSFLKIKKSIKLFP